MDDWKKKYKELKAIYNATISKHIAEKLDWLKQIGKLHDRIRYLEQKMKIIKNSKGVGRH